MTVASIHQNSFVVNVEWSVKFSCSTCTSFLIQNFTNYTIASIYQNSFVVNVKMVSENFLVALHFYFTIIRIISSLKNTIRIVSSDP